MGDSTFTNDTFETATDLGTLGFQGNTFEGRTTARIFDFDSVGLAGFPTGELSPDNFDFFTFDPYALITTSVNFNADTVGTFANILVFVPLSGVSKVTGPVVGTWASGDHLTKGEDATSSRLTIDGLAQLYLNIFKDPAFAPGVDFSAATWSQNDFAGADAVWTLDGTPVTFQAFGFELSGSQEQIDFKNGFGDEVDYRFTILPKSGEIDVPTTGTDTDTDPDPAGGGGGGGGGTPTTTAPPMTFVNHLAVTQTHTGDTGIDTLTTIGNRAEFSFNFLSDGRIIMTDQLFPNAPDTLVSVERVDFSDGFLAFDTDGNAGQAYRLYQAAFDRTPDSEGLGFWIRNFDGGSVNLVQMADYFMKSAEFVQRYGALSSLDDRAFLTLLYANVLDRVPDQSGFDFWSNQQANGLSRAHILQNFSESVENYQNVAGVIDNGIFYI